MSMSESLQAERYKLLTPEEIEQLTGAKRSDVQKRTLTRASIKFIVRHDGKPVTTWQAVNAALVPSKSEDGIQLNLDWIAK